MKTVFNDNSSKGTKFLAYFILFLIGFWFLLSIGGTMAATPEQKLERLRSDSCDRIRAKEETCHSRGETPCDFGDSPEWHEDKFNESIVQCFHFGAQDLAFGVGGL